jgi:hypothetical protein
MKKSFATMYPYLAYWIEDWGEMETTDGEYNRSRLTLIDMGGTRYEDKGSKSLDEAFEKAEYYLRNELFPEIFDQETIDSLEEDYKKYGIEGGSE